MTTQLTLASLKEALLQPFAPEVIQFLPKDVRKENGTCVCLALPYANKWVYEDRLNELVFGEWSSPYAPPYAQGNKLIIPATVVILGVAHTDYGEAFLEKTGKNGTTREDDNTATEAYSQAFRRACAKFFLGRYLYDLPRLTLPYDPNTHAIAVSKAERIAWVEKLYQTAGLLQKQFPAASPPLTHAIQEPTQPATETTHPSSQPSEKAPAKKPSTAQPTATKISSHPTAYPHDTFLDWVCHTVNRDPERLAAICRSYDVTELPQLSMTQRQDLTRRQQRLQSSSPQEASSAQGSEIQPQVPDRIDEQRLTALRRTLSPEQQQKSCRYYHVSDLAELTMAQALHLSAYIEAQNKRPVNATRS